MGENQPRVTPGRPDGGQWTERERAEAEVSLSAHSSDVTGRPAPMWGDDDERNLEPIAEPALADIKRGDFIRHEQAGFVLEGPVEDIVTYGSRRLSGYRIGGRTVTLRSEAGVYRVPEDQVRPFVTPRRETSPEELLDILRDLTAAKRANSQGELAPVFSVHDLIHRILGFDPSTGKSDSKMGGKTRDGWANEWISVTAVKKHLEQLVEDGELIAVRDGAAYQRPESSAPENYVRFPYGTKSGYVTRAAFDDAKVAVRAAKREQRVAKLRAEAEKAIATRYAAEVEAELERLIGEDPEL